MLAGIGASTTNLPRPSVLAAHSAWTCLSRDTSGPNRRCTTLSAEWGNRDNETYQASAPCLGTCVSCIAEPLACQTECPQQVVSDHAKMPCAGLFVHRFPRPPWVQEQRASAPAALAVMEGPAAQRSAIRAANCASAAKRAWWELYVVRKPPMYPDHSQESQEPIS